MAVLAFSMSSLDIPMLQYIVRNMKATKGASIKGIELDLKILTVMA